MPQVKGHRLGRRHQVALGVDQLGPQDVRPALDAAFASPEPWVLEFIVDPLANVMPMIPPGGTVDETIRKY